MVFKIMICDDNSSFLMLLKRKVVDCIAYGNYADYQYDIVVTSNSQEALSICVKNQIHIAILDIDMPIVNGFDIASLLHTESPETKIIFVSGFENMVYTSFRFNPFRFIRKSQLDIELKEALDSAIDDFLQDKKYISVGSYNSGGIVLLCDILYMESRKNYVEIHTSKGNKYTYRSTLSNMEEQLKKTKFARIHTGYLVNLRKVKYIHKDEFELENGEKLKASKKYFTQARERYFEYLRK